MTTRSRIAYVVAFAAPPVLQLAECLTLLRRRDWQTFVTLSPTAATWTDCDDLKTASGNPVRIYPDKPMDRQSLPDPDVILAAPLTFNSICKWAAGINDTLALGVLNEGISSPTPITAALCVKGSLRKHPAYSVGVSRLQKAGVHLLETEKTTSSGIDGLARFNWQLVVSTATNASENASDAY